MSRAEAGGQDRAGFAHTSGRWRIAAETHRHLASSMVDMELMNARCVARYP